MMRILLAIAALAMGLGVAQADGPHEGPRPFTWSGLYLGAHAGYGWGDFGVDLSTSSGAVHYNDPFKHPQQSLEGGDGWVGGFQIGANKQFGMVVVGIEADVSWTGMEADGRFTTKAPHFTTWDVKTELDMFGTVRGRLGVTNGPLLMYVTGGMAWGITDTSQATNWFAPAPPDVGGRTSGRTNHIGWTAGAGVEWMFAPNWTFRTEYLYISLGEENYALSGTTKPNGTTPYVETFAADLDFHVVRGAVNYKF